MTIRMRSLTVCHNFQLLLLSQQLILYLLQQLLLHRVRHKPASFAGHCGQQHVISDIVTMLLYHLLRDQLHLIPPSTLDQPAPQQFLQSANNFHASRCKTTAVYVLRTSLRRPLEVHCAVQVDLMGNFPLNSEILTNTYRTVQFGICEDYSAS